MMTDKDLVKMEIRACVNYAGVGSVMVTAISDCGEEFVGLISPEKSREVGQTFYKEAETAEINDILTVLLKNILDLEDDAITDFLIEFRNARED
jgi:hypothetical protein